MNEGNTYTPQHTRDATNHQRHTYNIVVHTDTYIYLMHIVNSTNVDGDVTNMNIDNENVNAKKQECKEKAIYDITIRKK